MMYNTFLDVVVFALMWSGLAVMGGVILSWIAG